MAKVERKDKRNMTGHGEGSLISEVSSSACVWRMGRSGDGPGLKSGALEF